MLRQNTLLYESESVMRLCESTDIMRLMWAKRTFSKNTFCLINNVNNDAPYNNNSSS